MTSISPEMFKQYKGLQDNLDYIVRTISEFNFDQTHNGINYFNSCDAFLEQLSGEAEKDTKNILIKPKKDNDTEWEILHKSKGDLLGSITKINLL